jgi:hypothetical protein
MLLPLYARFRAVSKGFRLNKPIECPIFPCEVAVNGDHLGCNYFSHVGVSISKREKCTLSGASAKFRRFLEAQQFRSDGEGEAAFVFPTQTGAYAHSNR